MAKLSLALALATDSGMNYACKIRRSVRPGQQIVEGFEFGWRLHWCKGDARGAKGQARTPRDVLSGLRGTKKTGSSSQGVAERPGEFSNVQWQALCYGWRGSELGFRTVNFKRLKIGRFTLPAFSLLGERADGGLTLAPAN